jgi:hypothetical protein
MVKLKLGNVIEIEFNEPIKNKCECCGYESTTLTRFVYSNGNAHSVYYIKFTENHDDKFAFGVISLGDWGINEIPEHRFAFPFEIRMDDDNFQIGMVNKENSPWSNVELLGEFLDRKESLEHEWIDEVFHITDHILTEDKIVLDYFQNP